MGVQFVDLGKIEHSVSGAVCWEVCPVEFAPSVAFRRLLTLNRLAAWRGMRLEVPPASEQAEPVAMRVNEESPTWI